MIPLLLIASGPRHRAVRVDRELILGRQDDCDVQLDHPSVSRRHARVIWQNRAAMIEDLGSRNGTWLGGQRLRPRQQLPLGDGQAMRLGDARMRFCLIDSLPTGSNPRRGEEALAHLLTFDCPQCRRRIGADLTMIGFVDRCPRCRILLLVPPLETQCDRIKGHSDPSPIGEPRAWEAVVQTYAMDATVMPSADTTPSTPTSWDAAMTATTVSHDRIAIANVTSRTTPVPDKAFARTTRLQADDLLTGPCDAPVMDQTDQPHAVGTEAAHDHAATSGYTKNVPERQIVDDAGTLPVDVPDGAKDHVTMYALKAALPVRDTMREQLRNRERDWWAISLIRRLPNPPNAGADGRPRA